jgi:hypothetical protein
VIKKGSCALVAPQTANLGGKRSVYAKRIAARLLPDSALETAAFSAHIALFLQLNVLRNQAVSHSDNSTNQGVVGSNPAGRAK